MRAPPATFAFHLCARTDWQNVYRHAGAYEASKLEVAIRVRALAAEHDLGMIEVKHATVAPPPTGYPARSGPVPFIAPHSATIMTSLGMSS
jgi:hypothetical protein